MPIFLAASSNQEMATTARIGEMLASLNTAILPDWSVAELAACVSGARVYERLEDPFRSGICSKLLKACSL